MKRINVKNKAIFLIFVFVFMFSIYYIANRDIVYQEHDNRVSTCQWRPCCINGQTKNDNYACRNTASATCGECTTPSSSSSSKNSSGSSSGSGSNSSGVPYHCKSYSCKTYINSAGNCTGGYTCSECEKGYKLSGNSCVSNGSDNKDCSVPSGCASFDSQSCTCTSCGGMGQRMAPTSDGKSCVDLDKDSENNVCCQIGSFGSRTLKGKECQNASGGTIVAGSCKYEIDYNITSEGLAHQKCKISVSINGSFKKVSKGDTVTATITATNCKNKINVSCGNMSGSCTYPTATGVVVDPCRQVTVTATGTGDESSATGSASVGNGENGSNKTNAYDPWYKTNTVQNTISSVISKAISAADANSKGVDEYYSCSGDKCDVYSRKQACGGGTSTPKNPDDPDPKSYCCVANDGQDKYWVENSSTKVCKDGYTVKENILKSACDYNPPKYSYCCVSNDNSKRYWVENDAVRKCYGNYRIDTSITNKSGCNACYANAPKLINATKAAMQDGSSVELPYLISGITKASDCTPPPAAPKYCIPKEYGSNDEEKKAGSCEGDVVFKQSDGQKCEGNSFYEIKCDTTSTVSFDFGDDKKSESTNKITSETTLLKGTGVKFGIYVNTERKCKATFNATAWKEAYKRTEDNINYANKYINNSHVDNKDDYITLKNEMLNKQEELRGIITKYNSFNYLPNYKNEAANVKIVYKVNNEERTLEKDFQSKVVSVGEGRRTGVSEVDLSKYVSTKVYNYTWSNKAGEGNTPRVIKLIPTKTYFDKITGQESPTGVDGGNKIYLDYGASPTKDAYILNIEVTGIFNGNSLKASSSGSSVKNDKCSIKIADTEIKYRPIDVTNPFINSEWNKGENWQNSYYDFTGVIHATTWSEELRSIVDLDKDQINALKESTTNNASSYLGLCDKYEANMYPDNITGYICSKIK